jgi:hypothetical protein
MQYQRELFPKFFPLQVRFAPALNIGRGGDKPALTALSLLFLHWDLQFLDARGLFASPRILRGILYLT